MPNILVSTLGTWSILPEGGLSLWEIFLLIRNGFKASFLDRGVKHHLIREAERGIMSIVQMGLQGL